MNILFSTNCKLCVVALLLSFAACSGGGGSTTATPTAEQPSTPVAGPQLTFEFNEPPFDLVGSNARFASNLSYGSNERHVLDLFLPDSDMLTPLAIYIHGGGFTGGSKESAYVEGGDLIIRSLLAANIAFASINYRLLSENDPDGVIKPMTDSQNALQFLRYYADSLNIDKDAVGLLGGSAGAGTSLWLAFSDDRADPGNADPILRESTRVLTAVAVETQGTYDLVRWETDVFVPFNITLDDLAQDPELAARILSFNGIADQSELFTQAGEQYRANIDMLALMSADDPEFFVSNAVYAGSAPVGTQALLHHPRHGEVLLDRANFLGVPSVVYLPQLGINDSSGENAVDFLIRKLNQ
ncbi:MAG: alpha/beta hydrolase fold domain-containing protein [Pseudomonadota bacterium]